MSFHDYEHSNFTRSDNVAGLAVRSYQCRNPSFCANPTDDNDDDDDDVIASQGSSMAANDSAYDSSPTTLVSQSAGSSGQSDITHAVRNQWR